MPLNRYVLFATNRPVGRAPFDPTRDGARTTYV